MRGIDYYFFKSEADIDYLGKEGWPDGWYCHVGISSNWISINGPLNFRSYCKEDRAFNDYLDCTAALSKVADTFDREDLEYIRVIIEAAFSVAIGVPHSELRELAIARASLAVELNGDDDVI